jgi:2-dehydro-3-deoxygluconokinase
MVAALTSETVMPPNIPALDIVAFGEPMIELNQTVSGGPYQPGYGGDTSNAVIAAARSGARTGYFTGVGADAFGRAFADLWRVEGVDISHVKIDASAHTAVYFVTHGPSGHEFSYLRTGSAASRIMVDDVPRDYIQSARILHVSGISQAISASAADAVFAAIDIAKSAGRRLSYDTNLRLKLWPLARARAIIHEAMRSADIALPGLDDAEKLTGLSDPDAIADFYLRLGAEIVALTLGKSGSLIATTTQRLRVPSIAVNAIDATAAGDTFDGAFLAEYLATADPFRAGKYANAAAAISTTGYGAVASMPNRRAVLNAIGE